jgi:hypothetical protein
MFPLSAEGFRSPRDAMTHSRLRKGSRMSRLPLLKRHGTAPRFRIVPEDALAREDAGPVILPFLSNRLSTVPARCFAPRFSTSPRPSIRNSMDPLTRARVLHDNRRCPHCRRGGVIPLDLGDGDFQGTRMPVPGSATLVGFYCPACGAEWSV